MKENINTRIDPDLLERFTQRYDSKERCIILEEYLTKLLGEDIESRIIEQNRIIEKAQKERTRLKNIMKKEEEMTEKKIDKIWDQFKKETDMDRSGAKWNQKAWLNDYSNHPWFERMGINYTKHQVYCKRSEEIEQTN